MTAMHRKHLFALLLAVVAVLGAAALLRRGTPSGSHVPAPVSYDSADVQGLPSVTPMQTRTLQDGETFQLSAGYVEKRINGIPYRMLAYNGSVPGPVIRVAKDAEVTVSFTNETGMPTLLHSHGVRMDNPFDGAQTVQAEMRPGETFGYRLKFPDAGAYWYHPHVREDLQQELGLYGAYIVVPDDGYWNPADREEVLFLDDVLVEDGRIIFDEDGADHLLMGRYGNVMLTNGETDYRLQARTDETLRLFVTNAANARPFNFGIKGTRMKLVGGDNGAAEKEEWRDAVLLGPSERAIVEVQFAESGTYALEHRTPNDTYALGSVTVEGPPADAATVAAFGKLRANGQAAADIEPFRKHFGKPVDKRISLTVEMRGMTGMGGHHMPDGTYMEGMRMGTPSADGIEWEDDGMAMMNAMARDGAVQWHIRDQDTGKQDMDIAWTFARGEAVKIRITNDGTSMHPMQHPFHLHGQRFLVLDRNGTPNDNLVWKDTVMVPAGQYVDILLDASNPGTWMAHCHIAEHLEAGMMMEFTVE